jgi:hypothetical protein
MHDKHICGFDRLLLVFRCIYSMYHSANTLRQNRQIAGFLRSLVPLYTGFYCSDIRNKNQRHLLDLLLHGIYPSGQDDSWIRMAYGARAGESLSDLGSLCADCVPISDAIVFVHSSVRIKGCFNAFVSRVFSECELLQPYYADSRVASLASH